MFDDNGFYAGPLGRCPHEFHEPLLGFNVELQTWNTAGSAAYPEALCEAIALDVVSALPLCMAMQGEHASVTSTSPSTVQAAFHRPCYDGVNRNSNSSRCPSSSCIFLFFFFGKNPNASNGRNSVYRDNFILWG